MKKTGMGRIIRCVLFAYFLITLVGAKLGNPPGPLKLHSDVTDCFMIWETFESMVAISDSNNDTVFECSSAWRTEIDPETQTATFDVDFGAQKVKHFHVKPGDLPSAFIMNVGEEPEPFEGQYYYTDNENCYITYLDYHGDECILWARKEVKDEVPQHCIDNFVDICAVVVPKYSRHLCPDGKPH
ncbi:uncharacterized protein LOC144153620 [Haemaphysalis longicornis]